MPKVQLTFSVWQLTTDYAIINTEIVREVHKKKEKKKKEKTHKSIKSVYTQMLNHSTSLYVKSSADMHNKPSLTTTSCLIIPAVPD